MEYDILLRNSKIHYTFPPQTFQFKAHKTSILHSKEPAVLRITFFVVAKKLMVCLPVFLTSNIALVSCQLVAKALFPAAGTILK